MKSRMKKLVTYLCIFMMGMMMTSQTISIQAAVKNDKPLDVVYYNQGDYPDEKIGGSTIKAAGCGPLCVAVCYSSLTGKKVNIPKICDVAYKKGWYITGEGCSHYVVPGLSKEYGLECDGLGIDIDRIRAALKRNNPVVVLMGPGDFTNNGHFIVITKLVSKNRVEVADVGSRANTAKTWSLRKIVSQSKDYADAGGPFWEISYKRPIQKKKTINESLLKNSHIKNSEKNIETVIEEKQYE